MDHGRHLIYTLFINGHTWVAKLFFKKKNTQLNHLYFFHHSTTPKNKEKKEISGLVLGIAERGGRTRSLKIKSLTLYRLS